MITIAEWFCRNISVDKVRLVKILDDLDADKDGRITVKEVLDSVRKVKG